MATMDRPQQSGAAASPDRAGLGARARRIDGLAQWLDRSIALPFTRRRIGMDGVIGLIPGVGDALAGCLSAYIIVEAARSGARKRVLARMAANTLIDTTLGAVPLVGDLFDFAFRANLRNARLAMAEIRRVQGDPPATRPAAPSPARPQPWRKEPAR